MSFAIKHYNGTYFEKWTGIGPSFGATREHAARFRTQREANLEMGKHFGFVMADVVKISKKRMKTAGK